MQNWLFYAVNYLASIFFLNVVVVFQSICEPATKYAQRQTDAEEGTDTQIKKKQQKGLWKQEHIDKNNAGQSWIIAWYEVCVVSSQKWSDIVHKNRPNKLGNGSYTLACMPRITITSNLQ